MNMGEIGNGLKLVELKKENVTRMCEQLNKQSSKPFLFTMQWRELEEHFDDVEKSIADKLSEVKVLEREVDERFKVVELKESELGCFETKMKECEERVVKMEEKLRFLEKSIEESSSELEEKERRLVLSRTAVDEFSLDVVNKENEVNELRKSIEECSRVLSLRRGELDSVNRTLKYQSEELGLKRDDLSAVESLLEDKYRDVDLENKKLASVQENLGECLEQLELKAKELASVERALEECERSIVLERKESCSLKKDLEDLKNTIKTSQDYLKLKEQQYASIQIAIDICTEEFDTKQKELADVKLSLRECSEELESKQMELKLIDEKRSKQLQELKLKDKNIISLEASVKERSEILDGKEKQLEEQFREFEVQKRWLLSQKELIEKHVREAGLKGKIVEHSPKVKDGTMERQIVADKIKRCTNATSQGPVKTESLGDSPVHHASEPLTMVPNFQASIGRRSLRPDQIKPLNESLMDEEILDALQSAPDPAKLVLDIIEDTYKKHLQGEIICPQNGVVETHIIFLKQLMIVAPPITEQVGEGARRLATEWKLRLDRVDPENHMEVSRFLHLLAAYNLVPVFRKAEILRFVEVVSLCEMATELCHALGFTENITGAAASTSDSKVHRRSDRKRVSANAPVDDIQAQSNKRRYTLRPRQVPHINNEFD